MVNALNSPASFYSPDGALKDKLAAPSWVMPGTIAQNALFLLNKVAEIGLCFFEWQSCLKYGAQDLQPWLANLPFSWHIHMPLDLPWHDGGERVAGICAALWQKGAFLKPRLMVLHPPANKATQLLAAFIAKIRRIADIQILLENTPHCDIQIFSDDFLTANGLGVCLDIGHALGYFQEGFTRLGRHAKLIHWSAPGNGDRHKPLYCLTEPQKKAAIRMAKTFQPGIVHLLEIFRWDGIEKSLPTLEDILAASSRGV